jgi:hypothetical protein
MKAALLALALLATARAGEIPASQWRVRAEMLVIRVPQREGIALVSRWADPEKCRTAFGEAQELITSGKATLVADTIAHGRGEEEMKTGMLETIRYSTELSRQDDRLLFAPKDGSKTLASFTTAFESRNCGVEFECYYDMASDGRPPVIRGSVSNCWLERMRRFEHALLKDGTKLFFELPIFHEAKDHFAAHLRDGETALVGTHLLAHPAGTMELRLLTTRKRPGIARDKEKMVENTRKDTASWQVCCEVQKFAVADSLALAIRGDAVDDAGTEAVFQRLIGEMGKGGTELTASSVRQTLSGERAVSETIAWHLYETEMGPHNGPGRPIEWGGPFIDPATAPATTFESREVGDTTEAEPVVSSDGRTIELMLDSKTVRMHGFTRWAGNRDTQGAQGFLYRPSFSSTHISTHLTLESGVRRCIGFQKIPGSDGRIELTFLKATTTPISR